MINFFNPLHLLNSVFFEELLHWDVNVMKHFKSQYSNVHIKNCYWVNAWVNRVNAKPFLKRPSLQKLKKETWRQLELKINYVLTCRIKTEWSPLKFQNDLNWKCENDQISKASQNSDHPDFTLHRRKSFPISCLSVLEGSRICFWRPKYQNFSLKGIFWNCSSEDTIVVLTHQFVCCMKHFTCLRQIFTCCMAVFICDSIFCLFFHVACWFCKIYLCKSSEFTMFSNYSLLNAFMQYTKYSSEFGIVRRKLPWITCSTTFLKFKFFKQILKLSRFILGYLYWSQFWTFNLLVLLYWFMVI